MEELRRYSHGTHNHIQSPHSIPMINHSKKIQTKPYSINIYKKNIHYSIKSKDPSIKSSPTGTSTHIEYSKICTTSSMAPGNSNISQTATHNYPQIEKLPPPSYKISKTNPYQAKTSQCTHSYTQLPTHLATNHHHATRTPTTQSTQSLKSLRCTRSRTHHARIYDCYLICTLCLFQRPRLPLQSIHTSKMINIKHICPSSHVAILGLLFASLCAATPNIWLIPMTLVYAGLSTFLHFRMYNNIYKPTLL